MVLESHRSDVAHWLTGGLERQYPCWIPWSHLASAPSEYSARSAYDDFFQGSVSFGPWKRIWKSWAPEKCHFFTWLAAHNKCWTVDRLARRGLQYPPRCPLCDQEGETINHLLVACVYSRQFWFGLLQRAGLLNFSPLPSIKSLPPMAGRINEGVIRQVRQGLNSIIFLGTWTIWDHRNSCVFLWGFTKSWEHHVVGH